MSFEAGEKIKYFSSRSCAACHAYLPQQRCIGFGTLSVVSSGFVWVMGAIGPMFFFLFFLSGKDLVGAKIVNGLVI